MKVKKVGGFVFTAFALSVAASSMITTKSEAIVAWARKYNMECNVCHIAGFKLTQTGQDFLRHGHTLPTGTEKEANLSDYASLTGKVRLSAKSKTIKETGKEDVKSSISNIEAHNFTIYTGGPLDNGFSYFAEMYLQENAGEKKTTDASDFDDFGRSKLAEAYLEWSSEGEDLHTAIRAGQIIPTLVHFNGAGARLSQSRPLLLSSRVGHNTYATKARQYGVSIAQAYKRTWGEFGIVNGTGDKFFNRIDNDNYKDIYLTLDQSFGDQGSMLGLYFYNGKYPVVLENPGIYIKDDKFFQYGLLGNYTISKGGIMGGLLFGQDKYQKTGESEKTQKSMGYFAEVQAYLLGDVLAPFIRYDSFDADTGEDVVKERNDIILGLNWKPLKHGRFVVELKKDTEKDGAKEIETNEALLEMNWMF